MLIPCMSAFRYLAFLVVMLATQAANSGDWQLRAEVDSMTDRERKVAAIQNETGHSLSIYRMPDGSVWANFALPKSNVEILSSGQWPIYRVDKRKPRDLDSERRLQRLVRGHISRTKLEPKWINFMVWHGNVDLGRSEELIELSDGDTITFRYFLFTGGYSETKFTLRGAGAVIAEAIDISASLKSGHIQRIEAMTSANVAERKICENNAIREDFSLCNQRVKSCASKAENSVDQFRQCVAHGH